MKQLIAILSFMMLVACSPKIITNKDELRQNAITDSRIDRTEQLSSLQNITATATILTDKSTVVITYYDTSGRVTAKEEIYKDVERKDTISSITDSTETIKNDIQEEHSDNSTIDTKIKEKAPLPWWVRMLMWIGVTAIIYVILRITWKVYIKK